MNFFASQARARRTTRWLAGFYLLSLVFITFLSSWLLLIVLRLLGVQPMASFATLFHLTLDDAWVVAAMATFIIVGGLISSFIKARELSKGGKVVAVALGGKKIPANTPSLSYRKVLNVVEEMAIASGMPTPDVYILQNEPGINAFAAGLTPTDAVIGLSQGAVDKLNRSQLQGVVGHEFSHILNGDMRLNIRLIMLVTGIEFVSLIGRVFTGASSRTRFGSSGRYKRKGAGALVLVGVLLRLLGWLGGLFGRVIQAAVSRQREGLADASAVQFTRNPLAVADALKVIGGDQQGARLRHPNIGVFSHLFFGQATRSSFTGIFATHPPLEARIKRLQPDWDGQFLTPLPRPSDDLQAPLSPPQTREQMTFLSTILTSATAAASITPVAPSYRKLAQTAQDPNEAISLVLAALLLSVHDPLHDQTAQSTRLASQSFLTAWAHIDHPESSLPGVKNAVLNWIIELSTLSLNQRLSLIEGAMPALKALSKNQYLIFKRLMLAMVPLKEHSNLYAQTVVRLVTRFLEVHLGLAAPYKVHYKKIQQVAIEVRLLLSLLAHYGHSSNNVPSASLNRAFQAGLQACGLAPAKLVELTAYSDNDANHAAEKLAHCSYEVKHRIMLGMQACIEFDGEVAEVERELILAMLATMEAPMPRFNLPLF